MKKVTDRTMQRWWRRAVLIKNYHRCAICGGVRPPTALEAHHLVRRRYRALRHDWRNGVPVCVGDCHAEADRNSAHLIQVSPHREHINRISRFRGVKEYLREAKMSLREFDAACLKELKEIVNERH